MPREIPVESGHFHMANDRTVGSSQRVDQQAPARPGVARADCKGRILCQAQCRRASGNIGCETFEWRRLRIAINTFEPFQIEKAFSEAKHFGHERCKLFTHKKSVITKPAPAHTFR